MSNERLDPLPTVHSLDSHYEMYEIQCKAEFLGISVKLLAKSQEVPRNWRT